MVGRIWYSFIVYKVNAVRVFVSGAAGMCWLEVEGIKKAFIQLSAYTILEHPLQYVHVWMVNQPE